MKVRIQYVIEVEDVVDVEPETYNDPDKMTDVEMVIREQINHALQEQGGCKVMQIHYEPVTDERLRIEKALGI